MENPGWFRPRWLIDPTRGLGEIRANRYRPKGGSFGAGVHEGVDINSITGVPILIYPARTGEVVKAQCNNATGYGGEVVIKHASDLFTRYAHLENIVVQVGDRVGLGDPIATMGGQIFDRCRGRSTGLHLHFEVMVADEYSSLTSSWPTFDPLPLFRDEDYVNAEAIKEYGIASLIALAGVFGFLYFRKNYGNKKK